VKLRRILPRVLILISLLPALLDSGAARSVISDSVYDKLRRTVPSAQETPVKVNCVTAAMGF
jgi:hypothetical protein